MAVSVRCPACDSAVQVPDQKIGQKVKCRACAEVFVAKKPGGRSKKSKGGSSSMLPLLGGLAAVVVLGGGGYLMFGRGGDNPAPAQIAVAPGTPVGSSAPAVVPATTSGPTAAPEVWRVVDPVKEPLEWTRGLKADIALPSGETKVTRPALPSPFVATTGFKGFTVFDLRSNQAVKHVDLPERQTLVKDALSPDGQHFAGCVFAAPAPIPDAPRPGPPAPFMPDPTLLIMSVASGQQVANISLLPEIGNAQWMEFRSPDELVVVGLSKIDPVNAPAQRATWFGAVVKTDGTVLRKFPIANSISSTVIGLTPGGKSLLGIETFVQPPNPVIAIDLDSGQSLGRANTADEVYKSLSLTDLSASPDGTQIAILQRYNDAFRVQILSAENGQKLRQLTLSGDPAMILDKRVGGDRGISWLGDGKHLVLFDGLVIKADSGEIVSDVGNHGGKATGVQALGDSLLSIGPVGETRIRTTPIELPSAP
jgi:hypothetical protein